MVILSRIWILVGIDRIEKPLHLFTHSPRFSTCYVSTHDTASGHLDMDSWNNSTIFNTIYYYDLFFFFLFGPWLLVEPPPRTFFILNIHSKKCRTAAQKDFFFWKGKSSLISSSELRVNFKRIDLVAGAQSG